MLGARLTHTGANPVRNTTRTKLDCKVDKASFAYDLRIRNEELRKTKIKLPLSTIRLIAKFDFVSLQSEVRIWLVR